MTSAFISSKESCHKKYINILVHLNNNFCFKYQSVAYRKLKRVVSVRVVGISHVQSTLNVPRYYHDRSLTAPHYNSLIRARFIILINKLRTYIKYCYLNCGVSILGNSILQCFVPALYLIRYFVCVGQYFFYIYYSLRK